MPLCPGSRSKEKRSSPVSATGVLRRLKELHGHRDCATQCILQRRPDQRPDMRRQPRLEQRSEAPEQTERVAWPQVHYPERFLDEMDCTAENPAGDRVTLRGIVEDLRGEAAEIGGL